MVSELVSNAFRHGEGQICLTVESGPDGVWAQVSDEGCPPAIATPDPRPARGGWGLQFVDRLADAWGVEDGRGARLVPHRPHAALLRVTRPTGTHIGVPVTGSGSTRGAQAEDGLDQLLVDDRLGRAGGVHQAVAQRDQVVRVAAGVVEVVQDDADRAALLVEVGEQVEHLELVREVEVGRRLVEQQDRRCPGRAPSRSTRAGAGRRRGGRAGGRAGRRCRSRPAPTRPARGPRLVVRRPSLRCGKRPRCTRSSTVSPSGGTGDCGRKPSRLRHLARRQRRDLRPVEQDGARASASAAARRRAAASTCRSRWRPRSP